MKMNFNLLVLFLGLLAIGSAGKLFAQTVSPTAKATPTAKISPVVSGTATPSASVTPDNTDEIKQKVQERLSKASKQKKAFVGTLMDIADATLKINTSQGIKMAATSDQTLFFRLENGIQVKVKINELPLSQRVIAMGYLENGNSNGSGQVMSAMRVISDSIPTPDTRLIEMGTVTNLTKKGDFTLQGVSGHTYTIKTVSSAKSFTTLGGVVKDFKGKLSEGDKVIVVGKPDKKDATLLTITLMNQIISSAGAVVISPSPTPKKITPTPTIKKTVVSPTPTVSL